MNREAIKYSENNNLNASNTNNGSGGCCRNKIKITAPSVKFNQKKEMIENQAKEIPVKMTSKKVNKSKNLCLKNDQKRFQIKSTNSKYNYYKNSLESINSIDRYEPNQNFKYPFGYNENACAIKLQNYCQWQFFPIF